MDQGGRPGATELPRTLLKSLEGEGKTPHLPQSPSGIPGCVLGLGGAMAGPKSGRKPWCVKGHKAFVEVPGLLQRSAPGPDP